MKTKYPLYIKIFIGLFIGLTAGLITNLIFPGNTNVIWFAQNVTYPIGQVFLRLIFMIIVPLIFTAIVLGTADFKDIKKVGRIGLRVLFYTFIITSVSVIIGLVLVNVFQPGAGLDTKTILTHNITNSQEAVKITSSTKESRGIVDILLNIIPRNPFYDIVNYLDPNYTGGGLLSLMFFALIFGLALTSINNSRTTALIKTLEGTYDVIMKIIDMVMKLAPYAVAALIFTASSQFGISLLGALSKYVFVVISALLIHFIFTYGFILKFFIKKNPLEFFKNISEVIITAFTTSSSNATLPTTIKVSIEKLKLDKDISNFILTIGSTANQNGTALYEGITVLFLAQFYGIHLVFAQQLMVVFLSILAGIGTAGIPGGSLPLVVMVLQVVHVPVEGIAIILGIDRILDMSRTVVNVSGDIVLAAWVDKNERTIKNN